MTKRIISVFLSLVLCLGFLCSCDAKGDIEQFVVFRTIIQDTNPLVPEEVLSPLLMPPAVDTLEAEKTEIKLFVGEGAELEIKISPDDAWNKDITFETSNESVATVDENGRVFAVGGGECILTVSSVEIPSVKLEIPVEIKVPVVIKEPEKSAVEEPSGSGAAENDASQGVETAPSHAQPTYINGILIANKTYALPSDYNPGVNGEAYAALMQMFDAAKAEGVGFWVASGFRSYDRQNRIYHNYVAQDGKAAADRYSARPGHSEHQTGLAFDLNYLTQAFGQSREGLWLAENCHKYGFIIRYPENKEHITGYMYEPWHVRYLGVDVATAVYESGLCLEEYLGITSVYAEN